jgi:DNA-binding transcriptional MerR regulator
VIVLSLSCLLKTDDVIEIAKQKGFPFKKGTLNKYKHYGVIDSPLFAATEGQGQHYAYYGDYVVDELLDVLRLKAERLTLEEIKDIIETKRPQRMARFLLRLNQEENQGLKGKARQSIEARLGNESKAGLSDESQILERRRHLATKKIEELEGHNDKLLRILEQISKLTEQVKAGVESNKSQIELLKEI